ncbi:phospholipase A [Caldimonas manganoxidans]|uniref:phospholipase A n=1 Tax=Caldimonas manganoxidans TaxID=196015 RepID=UPI000475408D|nr:phospholipase A [Caldimonas manganoxidans]
MKRSMSMKWRGACAALAWLGMTRAVADAPWVAPETLPSALAACAAVAADRERLACYDRLAARPASAQQSTSAAWAGGPSAAGGAEAEPAPTSSPTGLWSRFWELERADKRGTFRFQTYRPNFLLPVHHTSRVNQDPSSPTRPSPGNLPDYKHLGAKLQLSIRTKLFEGLLLPEGDLWFGYTQQSLWQVWNPRESAPFRSTDYEPELIYVAPVPEVLRRLPWGWQWRMAQLGLSHQSNGQAEPLSRSWNRVYLGAGFERGEVGFLARLLRRLPEPASDDDNPDLTHYRGRADFALTWVPGRATASLLYRSTLRDIDRGALQLDWTYPVDPSHPRGLRWYVQLFHGYGETLLDYNVRQTSLGIGLTLFEF